MFPYDFADKQHFKFTKQWSDKAIKYANTTLIVPKYADNIECAQCVVEYCNYCNHDDPTKSAMIKNALIC